VVNRKGRQPQVLENGGTQLHFTRRGAESVLLVPTVLSLAKNTILRNQVLENQSDWFQTVVVDFFYGLPGLVLILIKTQT
jgi:hypothetical protein